MTDAADRPTLAFRREIRRAVREAMRTSGLSAEQLAGLAPCSRNTVTRINRLENVTVETIDRLLSAAGMRVRIVVERGEITTGSERTT